LLQDLKELHVHSFACLSRPFSLAQLLQAAKALSEIPWLAIPWDDAE
jgi:hypothetical protein